MRSDISGFQMSEKTKLKFIIYTAQYDEKVGGAIALYKLGQVLRKKGFDVHIWPSATPHVSEFCTTIFFKKLYNRLKIFLLRLGNYRSPYNLDRASYFDLKDAIVVYPEIIAGNPLNSRKVVRWFLHKPGYHTDEINYGSNELYFYYDKQFDDPTINPHPDNRLNVVELMSGVYRRKNFGTRAGVCYMIRKGKDRDLTYHPKNAVLVDALSHKEMAEAFNEYEYFISYDMYTMYSRYAAMCGCKSIVVPMDGMSKEEWYPEEKCRYGIAYGCEDLPWAAQTRDKLIEANLEAEKETEASVELFVQRCDSFFHRQH